MRSTRKNINFKEFPKGFPKTTESIGTQQKIERTQTVNKQECLLLLSQIEAHINHHTWEGQFETENYLTDEEMRNYLPTFHLPEAEGIFGDTVYLPVDWMDNDTESLDYKEVGARYLEVYELLRDKASQEMEALSWDEVTTESEMHRDYWKSAI